MDTKKLVERENKNSKPQLVIDYLKEHWAIAASIGYLYLTIIGMLSAGLHFSHYQINIFEFAEINDFLLAAFREPAALATGAFMALYIYVLSREHPLTDALEIHGLLSSIIRTEPSIYWQLISMSFLAPIAINVIFYINHDTSTLKEVTLELRRGQLPSVAAPSNASFMLVGTSENFVFITEKTLGGIFVVPTSNLVAMYVKPKEERSNQVTEKQTVDP